ncbi:MAG: NG,NG-dimethylarginine dimethylaminohydrolase 1 (EC [uncultured Paraburkholderia sp.]|nr:MAG: NG,NG-dimethylarginine dimethylaminohydrolase 1 (EC [uncultured Paraburkholderia sp.]CAH2944773.1 MAG: NG,NG-dimethylarginine dimethylaminohydrolase 1 (EC [uncultured Paraburkholderia sp.]
MIRLLCPPSYFDVIYSINPWMDVNIPVDKPLADRQWTAFAETLRELGETVLTIDAQPGLPDMTFAGDNGLVLGNTFIPSNFRLSQRAGEVAHYIKWFEERAYTIRPLPADVVFEGLGDVVFHGRTALIGHGIRSDQKAFDYLMDYLPKLNILGDVRIVDDRYFHLAMAFGFLDNETVLYYPPAFDLESQQKIIRLFRNPIPLSDVDANEHFACNNLVINKTVLLDNCTLALRHRLDQFGYKIIRCPMSEFKKSGGSLRCLVLSFLDDELN